MANELDFEDPFAAPAAPASQLDFDDPFAPPAQEQERPGFFAQVGSQLLSQDATQLAEAYANEINDLRNYDALPWYKRAKYPSDPAEREARVSELLPELKRWSANVSQYQSERPEPTPDQKRIAEAPTLGAAFEEAAANPGAAFGLVGPSAAASLINTPQIVAAGIAGGPRTAALTAGGFAAEQDYYGELISQLNGLGYDTSNNEILTQALQQADALTQAQESTKRRALVVGGAAGLTTLLGGQALAPFVKPGVGRELANVGLQIPAQGTVDMAGEALAQQASGEGYKPGEVVLEGLGGAVTAPVGVAQAAAAGFKEQGKPAAASPADVAMRNAYIASLTEADDGEGGRVLVDPSGAPVGTTLDEAKAAVAAMSNEDIKGRIAAAEAQKPVGAEMDVGKVGPVETQPEPNVSALPPDYFAAQEQAALNPLGEVAPLEPPTEVQPDISDAELAGAMVDTEQLGEVAPPPRYITPGGRVITQEEFEDAQAAKPLPPLEPPTVRQEPAPPITDAELAGAGVDTAALGELQQPDTQAPAIRPSPMLKGRKGKPVQQPTARQIAQSDTAALGAVQPQKATVQPNAADANAVPATPSSPPIPAREETPNAPLSPLQRGRRAQPDTPAAATPPETQDVQAERQSPAAVAAGRPAGAARLPDAGVGGARPEALGGGTDSGGMSGERADAGQAERKAAPGSAEAPALDARNKSDAALTEAPADAISGAPRIVYRGTNDSGQRIQGGIAEGALFAAADEQTARLYGKNIERIAIKPTARVLVEGTPEFAKVTGRRRGKLMDTMRRGENLKTAADDAVAKAKAAGYDVVEFTSMKDLGLAILNENAVERDVPSAPAEFTSAPDSPSPTSTAPSDEWKAKKGASRLQALVSKTRDVAPDAYEDARLPGYMGEAVDAMARLFKKDVVVFRAKEGTDYAPGGLLFPADPSTIYLNADANVAPAVVFMHEMVHSMKRTDPDTYAKLEKAVGKLLRNKQGYVEFRLRGKKLSDELVTEEMIADVMADHASTPQFWSDLYARFDDKSAWGKFVDHIRALFSNVIDTLYPIGANNYVNDFNAAYQAVVDAAYNHARAQHGDVASDGQAMEMPAYHGTPHDFDRFSTAHMGSGEGAQAFGWGLYFAENEAVADGYRRALAPRVGASVTFRGEPVTIDLIRSLSETDPAASSALLMAVEVGAFENSDTVPDIVFELRNANDDAAADWLEQHASHIKINRPTGQLYKVEIPDDAVAQFLDFDNPISEQAPGTQAKVKQVVDAVHGDGFFEKWIEGAEGGSVRELQNDVLEDMSDEQVSRTLLAAGIPGIKFLDSGSRDNGGGTRNLVLFDDSIVTITHKNGRPVTKSERAEFIEQQKPKSDAPLESPMLSTPPQGSPPSQSLLDEGNAWWRAGARMWDNMNRMRILQDKAVEKGLALQDKMNVWVRENLSRSKMRVMADKVTDDYQRPIFEMMKKGDFTLKQVDDFIYAKHAPERNREIAKINPKFPDGGSGMKNAEAARILASYTPEQTKQLDAIAQKLYDMQAYKLSVMEQHGLTEPSEIARLKALYKHYVPLKTIEEATDAPGNTGRGIEVKHSEYKAALGRASRATSPLMVSFQDMARTLVRAHKNDAGNALLSLARDPVLATMLEPASGKPIIGVADPTDYMRQVTDAQGNVTMAVPSNWWQNEEVFVTKENGVQRYIAVRDPELMAQLRRMGDADIGPILNEIGGMTRLFARMLTQYNPVFAPVNLIRDAIQASILSLGVPGLNPVKVMAGILPNMARILVHKARPNTRYAEFLEDGASTNAYGLRDLEDALKEVENVGIDLGYTPPGKSSPLLRGTKRLGRRTWRRVGGESVFSALAWYNEAFENAVRLSTYNAMRDIGVSREQAAFQSKELSTNFNKKGQWSSAMNAAYVFVNAAMQGNRALLKFAKRPGVQVAIVGLVAAGVLQDMLGAAFGGDDDESGLKNIDEVGDWALDHNIIILTGQDKQVKIPLPYGLNLPFVFGRRVSKAIRTGNGFTQMSGILNVMADNFSPIGGFEPVIDPKTGEMNVTATTIKTILPSLLRPAMSVATNSNFMGQPIARTPFQGDQTPPPRSVDFKPGTADYAVWLAERLNKLSGGDKAKPGDLDVSPEHIEFLLGEYTGGAGRFVSDMTSISTKLATGKAPEIEWSRAPFIRSFSGVGSSRVDLQACKLEYSIVSPK